MGDKWQCVEQPSGTHLKQISVGPLGIWTVDQNGKIYIRKEVTHVFPEGTHWHCLNMEPPIIGKL